MFRLKFDMSEDGKSACTSNGKKKKLIEKD